MEKERLDMLLVKKGLFQSRERARSSIMAGIVNVNGSREDKPGSRFDVNCEIDIKQNINPYVSRGGLKLEKAMSAFGINLQGKTAMDVGASTGGFTDCMLKNGAARVFAVDVGYGQLAWDIRNDERVINMERTNIRYIKPESISASLDFASIDVSFISLKKVLPVVYQLLNPDGEVLCLIKPQFEAGREKVGKHGVVKDMEVHREVVEGIISFSQKTGFSVKGLTYSPIKGPEGNIEYLLHLSKSEAPANQNDLENMINDVIGKSHSELD
ncbi:MAG: TlyA family RNA methyltransferase [Ruminiclostridium sp.]|nr:TlyA family RNA methyltransferase [Ruminiclostridium sp.]